MVAAAESAATQIHGRIAGNQRQCLSCRIAPQILGDSPRALHESKTRSCEDRDTLAAEILADGEPVALQPVDLGFSGQFHAH